MFNNLQNVILFFLKDSPLTGYELNKKIRKTFAWTASHQQIYRELAKLNAQDLIDGEEVPQEGKPNKRVYSLTELGENTVDDLKHRHKVASLPRVTSETTVSLLIGNQEHFYSLIAQASDKKEELEKVLAQEQNPVERALIERNIALVNVEIDFSRQSIELLNEHDNKRL